MKKIGIVTITELDNFGNRLQNFALQKVMENKGFCVETIPNYIRYKYRKSMRHKINQIWKTFRYKDKVYLSELLKQLRFEHFDKEYIHFSKEYSTISYIPANLSEKYDYFLAGSDQIWNPYFAFNFDFNFLSFAPKEKRIVYAASIGVDTISDEKKAFLKGYLNEIEHISLRETAGAVLAKQITGKSFPVVLDPTMLLSANDWEKIEKKPIWAKENDFALVYSLGEKNSEQLKIELSKLDTEFDSQLDIINLSNKNTIHSYSIRPDEFLWLVHHTKIMITDSFHGMVFSLLFGTPFIPITRDGEYISMNSRIVSLFQMFGINWEGGIVEINREEYLNRLSVLKIEAHDYIDRAFGEGRRNT